MTFYNLVFINNRKIISILLLMAFSLNAYTQSQRPVLTLPIGHQQPVHSVDFSKDGKLIVTGGLDNTFILWDAKTGFIIRRTQTEGAVQQVIFTPDGSQLISLIGQSEANYYAKQKPVIQKWDVKTGKMLMKFPFTGSPGMQILRYSGYLLVPDYSDDLSNKTESLAEKFDITNPDKMLKEIEKMYGEDYNDSIDKVASKKSKEIRSSMGQPDFTDKKQVEEWHKKMMQGLMPDDPTATMFERNITLIDLKTLKPIGSVMKTPEQVKILYHYKTEYIITEHETILEKNGNHVVAWEVNEFINQYKEKRKIKAFKEFPVAKHLHILSAAEKGFFAVNAGSNSVQLWHLYKPDPVGIVKTKGSNLDNIEFSPNGDTLYAYSTTGTVHFIEAWNTTTLRQVLSYPLPVQYNATNIRLFPSGEYFAAGYGFGLIKLSLTGDSLTKLHGNWAMPSYYGFSKNDKEVYVAYNVSEFMEASVKQAGITTKEGNAYVKQAFETMVEEEAKAQNKTLTKVEKEKLVAERMKLAYSAVTSESYKGYALAWDLLHGGAKFQKTSAYAAPHKTISVNKNYELANEKYESANNEIGNMLSKQMGNMKKSEYFSKDSMEKSMKELQKAGAIGYISEDMLKDPIVSTSKYLDQLLGIVSQDALNSPVTLLINRKKDTISLIKIDSIDWIMLLKNGYYMTSHSGAKSLSYTRGLDVMPFEQFDVKYNRPDKILQTIGLADATLIEAYRNAWLKRIKKNGIDTTQFRDEYEVPVADFDNRSKIEHDQKTDKLSLIISGADSKNKLDRFNIWVNEVPVFGKNGKSIKDAKSNKLNTTVEITLSQGTNRIETSVMNANGVESYHVPLFVKYTPDKPVKEITHFVGIGIDQFADNKYNLQYSAKDIRDLSKKLKEKYGAAIVIDTLFNQNVTVANIKALKQKLQQTTENDKVIIAYSGHGMLSKDFDYYLSTYSINFEKPEQNGLPYDDLEDLVDNIPARKKLMLIDACHSGEVDKEDLVTLNTSPATLIKGIKPVAYKKDGQLGLKNSFELMQSLFVNVGKSTGATIISAAAGTQFALERGDLKNGIFTYSILEAMNKYPTLKISELKKIVGERVVQLTNGLQKPTSRNETIAVDWNVW